MEAVRQNEEALKYVKEQTKEICLLAVKKNGFVLNYVEEQTDEICIGAVRQNGYALKFVKEQNEEICIEAVRRSGWALQYVKEQTHDICLIAVEGDASALRFVKRKVLSEDQFDKICRESLKQDRHLIGYIKDKEKYLEEFYIRYLKKQGKAREVIAIKEDGEWLFTVGCQEDIDIEEFIYRIYDTDGGFDPEEGVNVHRQVYLDFLKEF
ncbi:DUF4116 domain-containing protein [Clostridioides difficile]|nr:DUF4116 domain-containing protein [Clostridioides difficile]